VRKVKVPAFARGLPLIAVVFLGGCSDVTVLNPKGQVGADEKSLILTAAILMLIVVIPVIIMTIVFAWRYRASNTKAAFRPDWAHSRPVEIVVWLIPIIIVSALGYLAWTRSHSLDPFRPLAAGTQQVTIQVVSLDWKWLFIYPDEHIATVNEIAFPVNVPVEFRVTSDTVMNSFFIPQLGSQIYSMAGMQTEVHLIANQEGSYGGISANFSGEGFSGMKFSAIALSQAEYQGWLAKVRASSEKLDASSFALLEKPSENNPVEYFSQADPDLFANIINKFMGGTKMSAMQTGAGS